MGKWLAEWLLRSTWNELGAREGESLACLFQRREANLKNEQLRDSKIKGGRSLILQEIDANLLNILHTTKHTQTSITIDLDVITSCQVALD